MTADLTHLDTVKSEQESQADGPLPDTTEPQVDDIFEEFRNYLKMAARGEQTGVYVHSRPGIGKSYQAEELLKEEVDNRDSACHRYRFVSGYVSPLSLYEVLYASQEEGMVIVFDDITFGGHSQAKRCANLLKGALEGEGSSDRRTVEWRSKSSTLRDKEMPEQFVYNGTCVFIANDKPDSVHWEAVLSRCLVREFNINYSDRMRLIEEVAKADHGFGFDYSTRMSMAHWITDRATPDMEDVDLRTLIQAFELRASSVTEGDEWKRMLLDQLGYGRRERIAREAVAEAPNWFEAQILYRNTIEQLKGIDEEDEVNWFFEQFDDKQPQIEYVHELRTEVLDTDVPKDERVVEGSWYYDIQSVGDAIDHWEEMTGYNRKTFYNRKNARDGLVTE